MPYADPTKQREFQAQWAKGKYWSDPELAREKRRNHIKRQDNPMLRERFLKSPAVKRAVKSAIRLLQTVSVNAAQNRPTASTGRKAERKAVS